MKRLLLALSVLLPFCAAAQESDAIKSAPVLTTSYSGYVITRFNSTFEQEDGGTNGFSVRLARIMVQGKILSDFNYRLQLQVNGTSGNIKGPRVVDAYVEWQKYKPFYVKFGQFKRAFTFENPMNPIDQGFYSYAQCVDKLAGMNDRIGEHASNGRDMGIQFQGDLFTIADHPFMHYQIGLYNGQGINVSDLDNKKDLIGGLWFIPIKGARIGAFGWNGRYTRGTTTLERKRYAISGEYKTSDWTFRSEYIHSFGYAFQNGYGDASEDLNTTLGTKSDGWYALVIAPIIKNTCHVKARYDVYRDNASFERMVTNYDLGADYQFSKNLVLSLVGSYVNNRKQEDYGKIDLQVSFRF